LIFGENIMNTAPPPGFDWHSNNSFNKKLLLPQTIVKQLAKQVKLDREYDQLHSEINEAISQLLLDSDLSLEQLCDNVIAYAKQSKQVTAQESFSAKTKREGKYIKIFDIKTILLRARDKTTTRNAQSVLKRFKEDDIGERLLKTVPTNFKQQIQALKTQYPNCKSFLDYVESFSALASKQPYPAFYFPPVLLVGPPGIGKTAVVNAVAELAGVASRQVDLASTTAGMILGGMSTQWSDAKCGVIIDLLRDNDAANPIVILDEIDKASSSSKYDPLGPLYCLLEQRTATKFIDEALDLPSDASCVIYVATANSSQNIPKPILSRFITLQIEAMSAEQHGQVTQSIYASLLQQHECAVIFKRTLSKQVIEALRNHPPRIIKAILRRALAQAAMRDPDAKKLTITLEDLIFSEAALLNRGLYDGSRIFGFSN
jgi:ATP-dependent Lon protease